MSFELSTLAGAWLAGGIAFAAWVFHQQKVHRDLLETPLFAAAPRGAQLLCLLLGVLLCVVVWPLGLVLWLRKLRKPRSTQHTPYRNRKLAVIRSRLAGKETTWETILPKLGLPDAVTALHAVDLNSLDGKITYADIVAASLAYTEFRQLLATHHPAGRTRSRQIALSTKDQFPAAAREAAMCIGGLITGYVHGWLSADNLDQMRTWYAGHLKPEYSSAEFLHRVFSPIAAKAVTVTKTDNRTAAG